MIPQLQTVRVSFYRPFVSLALRRTLFFRLRSTVEQLESEVALSRTSIRKMRVADLRMELTKRGLNAEGNKPVLVEKLLHSAFPTNFPGIQISKSPEGLHTNKSEGLGNVDSSGNLSNYHEPIQFLTNDSHPSQSKILSAECAHESIQKDMQIEDCKSLLIVPNKKYILRFDGGSRGNPGKAGAGMVIYDEIMQEVWYGSNYLGPERTNNEAEYTALTLGLQCAIKLGIKNIVIEGDSELIIRQLEGRYRVKNANLKRYHALCVAMLPKFETNELRHIRRENNARADQLANVAMDSEVSKSFVQG
jgi:ribonuclease HI